MFLEEMQITADLESISPVPKLRNRPLRLSDLNIPVWAWIAGLTAAGIATGCSVVALVTLWTL